MTPKEKAKKIVFKMQRSKHMPNKYAKQCALIAVDELILISNNIEIFFWQEVKQEIEKL